jgi:hypothetical protein
MAHDPMRRCRIEEQTFAERKIREAVAAIDVLPADVRLTEALVLMEAGRERVAYYVDRFEGVSRFVATNPALRSV